MRSHYYIDGRSLQQSTSIKTTQNRSATPTHQEHQDRLTMIGCYRTLISSESDDFEASRFPQVPEKKNGCGDDGSGKKGRRRKKKKKKGEKKA